MSSATFKTITKDENGTSEYNGQQNLTFFCPTNFNRWT